MLLALTGYETALAIVAGIFIVFALVVALVVPRSRPGFPGDRLGAFLGVCVLLFAAQLTAVLVLAERGEAEEPAQEAAPPAETTGDPVAGKEVFLGSAGCKGCHTLADAGTSGNIGPNLDAVKPSYEKVVMQVTEGGGVMPAFADSLSEQQIQDVAAYVSSATDG